jgi:hypothetical protein
LAEKIQAVKAERDAAYDEWQEALKYSDTDAQVASSDAAEVAYNAANVAWTTANGLTT